MIKYLFTTVASCDCLFKLLLLYKSLYHHHKDFVLFVLCTDSKSYIILKDLGFERMKLIKAESIEDDRLILAKKTRSFMEYCWTMKSAVLNHVMKNYGNTGYYIHVDSDLCFFSNIDCVFEEAPDASIFITDHNNSDEFLYTYETSGRFNSGFIGFRNDTFGRNAIKWWMDKCIEWCYVSPDVEKRLYGDQRYLEGMYENLHGVHVISNKGANAAHWNIKKYKIAMKDGSIYLDDDKLIFYHFSGFSILSPTEFNISCLIDIDESTTDMIYLPYMILLADEIKHIQKKYKEFDKGFFRCPPEMCKQYYKLKG